MAATVLEVFHLANDSGGYDQDGKPFEKHVYKVRWSSPDHYPLESIGKSANGVSVPYWGKQLRSGSILRATQIDCQKINGKPNWTEVTVNYDVPELADPFIGQAPNQDTWNKTVTVQTQEMTESINADEAGNPLTNSAGVIYDLSISNTFYDEIITIAFNAKAVAFDPVKLSEYRRIYKRKTNNNESWALGKDV